MTEFAFWDGWRQTGYTHRSTGENATFHLSNPSETMVQVGLGRGGYPWAVGGGFATLKFRFISIRFLLKSPD
jgi:hypothetical protein